MSAAVILLLQQRGLWKKPLRGTRTWVILEKRDGWWVVVSEHNYKPYIIPGQRLVREYK